MTGLSIPPKYARFFLKNLKTRHILLQGSRRSGKSFAAYKWLTLLAHDKTPTFNYIICASFPALTLSIKDFQLATGIEVQGSSLYGHHVKLPNGSIIAWRAFDDPTKPQGSSCVRAIIEEALNIPEDIITTFLMGVEKQVIFIYNPTKTSHLEKYVSPDGSNKLITTFKDNPFLGQAQLDEFELIRQRGTSPTASVLERYAYQVYYKGEFSQAGGKVFPLIYNCEDSEYDELPDIECFGLDFGYVDSADATCCVGSKIHDGVLYLKQYLNSKHLSNNKDLAFALADLGLDCYSYICGDMAGLGKERMKDLCSAGKGEWTEPSICNGFNIVNAKKGRITDGLNRMLQYEKIVVTNSSIDLRTEMDRYEINPDGNEISKHQNLVDAARYSTRMHEQIYE